MIFTHWLCELKPPAVSQLTDFFKACGEPYHLYKSARRVSGFCDFHFKPIFSAFYLFPGKT